MYSLNLSLLNTLLIIELLGYVEMCYCFVFLKDLDACRKIISRIVSRVNAQLSSCLPCLDKIIQRSSYDRLSIIAANTILTAHNHFSITTDQVKTHILSYCSNKIYRVL